MNPQSAVNDNPQDLQRRLQAARGALRSDARRLATSTSALRAAWNAVKSRTHLVAGCGVAFAAGYALAPRRRRVGSWPPPPRRSPWNTSLAAVARGVAFEYLLRTALDYLAANYCAAERSGAAVEAAPPLGARRSASAVSGEGDGI